MGISAGEEMVRARRSARHRKAPPKRAESGSTTRWLRPARSRTVWGTMIPTKAMSPDTDTAAAVPRVATTITTRRRSEEHTSELQSLMRISYAVVCLQKNKKHKYSTQHTK